MAANGKLHRRALHRRLADVNFDHVQQLDPRFSPTAIYTSATDVITDIPTTSATEPATPSPDPVTISPTTSPTPLTTPTTQPSPTPTTNSSPSPPAPNPQTSQSTTSAVVASTPSITQAAALTTPQTSKVVATTVLTTQPSRSIASSIASPTSTQHEASSTNVGGIIGGIVAGLLGVVVLAWAIRYLARRHARKNSGEFDAQDFRRSAVLMQDPPTHQDTIDRGYNPRPPSMIEHRLASPAPTFGTQYGAPGPQPHYGALDQSWQYPAGEPGQVMMANVASPPPPNLASAMMPVYAQSPFSPISPAPLPSPYGSEFSHEGVAAGAAPYLTRQNSAGASVPGMQLARQPSDPARSAATSQPVQYPTSDYIDLSRSSVTPFQAAQYAEISQKLNTEVPTGLTTPAVNDYMQRSTNVNTNRDLPPPPEEQQRASGASPFADPDTSADPERSSSSIDLNTQDLNFPAPPSPAHMSASRFRVDSTPPTLPEIFVESRVSVGSYDVRGSSGSSVVPPRGLFSPAGQSFPTTPSPLASSFVMDSPRVDGAFDTKVPNAAPVPPPAAASSATAVAPAARPVEAKEEKKRPETLYDAEDAYGGI